MNFDVVEEVVVAVCTVNVSSVLMCSKIIILNNQCFLLYSFGFGSGCELLF
jgi:hypothetical protein